jgi:K+-sensing histidine kinase KdpD
MATTLEWTNELRPPAERAAWPPHGALSEYAIAVALIAGVTAIRWFLHPILSGVSPLLIFVLPTVVMVLRGARGPAVFATILSLAVALVVFIGPTDPRWWSHPVQQARLTIFSAETITIIAVGWMLQQQREQRVEALLQAERLRAMQATLRTVHDIVNNSLNQLQILRIDAEGRVPAASIAMFDTTIQETVSRLRALDDMTAYAEKPMAIGIGLDESPRQR